MARFLSSLKQMELLWQDDNRLPLCLNVFQQSLGRCLGTLSSKLHTHLLFLRKHAYCKCVWNRSYFPTSTPLNSPPTFVLHLSLDLSAWRRLVMPFSCIENSLLCCPVPPYIWPLLGGPSTSARCEYPWNLKDLTNCEVLLSIISITKDIGSV